MRPPEVIYGLDDGQRISGAGMTFTTIHTPGHTQGSVCFRLDIEGEAPILFSGDHLFQGSIGRTDLPGGSYEQLMASMAEKILPLPDETHVLPGTAAPRRRSSENEPVPARAHPDGNARPTRGSWSSCSRLSPCPRRDLNPHALAGKGF